MTFPCEKVFGNMRSFDTYRQCRRCFIFCRY